MKNIFLKFTEWTKLKFRIHTSEKNSVYFREKEIWWANLGQNINVEINGKNKTFERPVLVLKKFNKDALWVIPLTRTFKNNKYYFKIFENSFVVFSQLKMISSKRLSRKMKTLPNSKFKEAKNKIKNLL